MARRVSGGADDRPSDLEKRKPTSMVTAMGTARDPDEHFVPVADRADLERLFAVSDEQPIVLFKHSFACHISANAYRQLAVVPSAPAASAA